MKEFTLFKNSIVLKQLLQSHYNDMVNSFNEVDDDPLFREVLIATSLRLVKSLRSGEPNLDGIVEQSLSENVSSDDIKDIAELVIRITNYAYHNYGKEYIDDNLYDELSYLYKAKAHTLIFSAPLRKKSVEVQHSFPNLKGTLEKVRYLYHQEAVYAGKEYADDLETFLQKYEKTIYGASHPKIDAVVSLKYDGVSAVVKMEKGIITQVLTRGDNDMGADITPLFKNYKFNNIGMGYNQNGIDIYNLDCVGIQCELVFKKNKLEEFNKRFNKKYINGRSAVVGISSAFDMQKLDIDWSEYITLMPLNIDAPEYKDMRKRDIFELINTQLDSRTHWVLLTGLSPYEILSHFEIFKNGILSEREDLEYMVDGLVIEFDEPKVRTELGRTNNINNFAIAYKFPSQMKRTRVLNVFFNVGRTGEVIPMVEYEPVYFNGGEFKKSSLANITNFKLMNLKKDDIINVQYSNDVLCYVTKDPMLPENRENRNPEFEIPLVCPYCGEKLSLLSQEGLKLYCTNIMCPSRVIEHMTNFFDKLNIKDLGRETIQYLYDEKLISCLEDLLSFDPNILTGREGFGAKKIGIIKEALDKVHNETYKDYDVLGALGFRSAASTTFRPLCRRIKFESLLKLKSMGDKISLIDSISNLKGFGAKKSNIIVSEMEILLFSRPRLLDIINTMNIEFTYSDTIEDDIQDGFKVCFTNIRDETLENKIREFGGYVVPSVTKNTNLLIAKDLTISSSKIAKAKKYNIPIMTYGEFLDNIDIILTKLAQEFNNDLI